MQPSIDNSKEPGERLRPAPAQDEQTGDKVQLRPVRPEDAERIHQLLFSMLPDVPCDRTRWLARWRWQYWDNPFRLNRPAGWVLARGRKIVGHLGAVHVPLRIGQDRCTGMIGADYAVSAEGIQRGGAFAGLQLAQALFKESSDHIVLATTANEQTNAVFARFGCHPVEWTREFWRAPATTTQMLRTCRGSSNRVVRRLLSGVSGSALAGLLGYGCAILRHQPAIPIQRGHRLEISRPCSPCPLGLLYGQLIGQHMRPTDNQMCAGLWPAYCGIDRSQDYLDWRYVRNPEGENIRCLSVSDSSGQLLGCAIVFLDMHGPRRIAVVEEVIVRPDRAEVWRTVFCAALRLAWAHGMDYLVATTGRDSLRGLFWELGFQSRARNAPAALIMKTPECRPSKALREPLGEHFEFSHGDMF
ncbi:MAG: hypothetical protein GXY44_14555 [Phycisphaerales bacterium]|nr:hypothetical protein [Phycisphaerales bacterium]